MQNGRVDRALVIASGKQIGRSPREPPISTQDAEQLGDSITLRSLPPLPWRIRITPRVLSMSATRRLATSDSPEARRIGRRQRGAALQARDGFEKPHDFVGAQHDRQLTRLARIRDALGNVRLAERDAIEETQGAHDLVEPRPRDASGNKMDLEGADILKFQPFWRSCRNIG